MSVDACDESAPLPPPSGPPPPAAPKPAARRSSSKKVPQSGDRLSSADERSRNPFTSENAKWVRQQRRTSSVGRDKEQPQGGYKAQRPGSASRAPPQAAGLRARCREQNVLQALEKLDQRDTLEQGVRQLMEVLRHLAIDDKDLAWFLRLVYDERKPLRSIKARREQLFLLTAITRRFGMSTITSGALREKILPFIFGSLRAADTLDAASRTVEEIVESLVGDDDHDAFLQVFPPLAKALLDPLILGSGWDLIVKERCVSLLISFTKAMLRRASTISGAEVDGFLNSFSMLLVQCLVVNHGLHEGLFQCLVELAAEPRSCQGLATHASKLTEICRSHLVDTPSATPQYVPEASAANDDRMRSESPKRGTLTRELALVCCLFLESLAKDIAPLTSSDHSLQEQASDVLAALARDNLNLQRLTRANERLRQGVTHAWQAWKDLGDGTSVHRSSVVMSDMDRSFRRDRASSREAHLRDLSQGVLDDPLADVRSGQARHRSPGPVNQASRPSSRGRQANRGIQLGSVGGGNKRLESRAIAPIEESGNKMPESKSVVPMGEDENKGLESKSAVPMDGGGSKRIDSQPAVPMREIGAARISSAESDNHEACKSCGSNINRGSAFCGKCGASQAQEIVNEPCRSCGQQLDPQAIFCNRCGKSREIGTSCHNCGEALAADAQFCSKCGAIRDDNMEEELRGTVRVAPFVYPAPTAVDDDFAAIDTLQPSHRMLRLDQVETEDHLEDRPFGFQTSVSEFECAPEREPAPSRAGEVVNNGMRRPATSGSPFRSLEGRNAAGNAGVAARHLRAEASQTEPMRIGRRTQTDGRGTSTAGPMPRIPPQRVQLSEEEALGHSPQIIDWGLPRDEDAPYFSAALRFIRADRPDQAFQCVFRFGNEKTLAAVLRRLQVVPTWERLSQPDAEYLAHLLAKLVCKDPMAASSLSACTWLDGLLRLPGGRTLLAAEDLPDLQGALFSLSGAAGERGVLASSIYYRLFQMSGA